jgi:hypothetical protein
MRLLHQPTFKSFHRIQALVVTVQMMMALPFLMTPVWSRLSICRILRILSITKMSEIGSILS